MGSRDREFISDIIEENGRLLEYLKSSKFTLSRDRVSINPSLFNRIKDWSNFPIPSFNGLGGSFLAITLKVIKEGWKFHTELDKMGLVNLIQLLEGSRFFLIT